jgi:hypothetical protein
MVLNTSRTPNIPTAGRTHRAMPAIGSSSMARLRPSAARRLMMGQITAGGQATQNVREVTKVKLKSGLM